MLYDPKWNRNIYSKESFVAWLGLQPPDDTYDFCDMYNCASAQYLLSHGVTDYALHCEELTALGWLKIVHGAAAYSGGFYTFGAAYLRGMKELENVVWPGR